MDTFDTYTSTPIGSLSVFFGEENDIYYEKIQNLPPAAVSLVMSPETGTYIRNTIPKYNIPVEKSPHVAFAVLQFVCGQQTLSGITSAFSKQLQISEDDAQRLTQDIEQGLLRPIIPELSQHLSAQPPKKPRTNVIDLTKDNPNPPKSPNIPPPTS